MPRGRTSKKKSRRGRRGFHGRVEAPTHIRAVSPCRERETANNPPLPVVMGVPVAEASPPPVPVAEASPPPVPLSKVNDKSKWKEAKENFYRFKENVERETRAKVEITEDINSTNSRPQFNMNVYINNSIRLTKKEDDYIQLQAQILKKYQKKDKELGGLNLNRHFESVEKLNEFADEKEKILKAIAREDDTMPLDMGGAMNMFECLKEAGAKVERGGGFMATTIDMETLRKAGVIERNKIAEKKLKEEEKDIKKRLKEAIETERIKNELFNNLAKRHKPIDHPSLYKDCPCCASVRDINIPTLIKQEEEMCEECSSYDDDL